VCTTFPSILDHISRIYVSKPEAVNWCEEYIRWCSNWMALCKLLYALMHLANTVLNFILQIDCGLWQTIWLWLHSLQNWSTLYISVYKSIQLRTIAMVQYCYAPAAVWSLVRMLAGFPMACMVYRHQGVDQLLTKST